MRFNLQKYPLFTAFLLGAASVLGFAPFFLGFVPFLATGALYLILRQQNDCWRNLKIGFSFGLGLFLCGVSWVYVSLSTFGGLPMPLAALATLAFCAVLAIFPALSGGLFGLLQNQTSLKKHMNPFFFAAIWTLFEMARGFVLTGFPWLNLGFSQTSPFLFAQFLSFSGFAPVFGVYGVSFSVVLGGALLANLSMFVMQKKVRSRAFLLHFFACVSLLTSNYFLQGVSWGKPFGKPISVALLQGNIPQNLKWQAGKLHATQRLYFDLMREAKAELTVLPETAIPALYSDLSSDYLAAMEKLAKLHNGNVLFGVVEDMDRQNDIYTNAALSLGTEGIQRYHKRHLVPFGEFVPTGFSWFVRALNIPMSSFTRGAKTQNLMNFSGQKIAVNICYEDAFGEEIIADLPEATILVNISNVAWFGDSLAPHQHLQIAQMRAAETARPMLRATNTGMTAIISQKGQVTQQLPAFTQGALSANVQGFSGQTPFVRFGNWAIFGLALGFLFCAICLKRHSLKK